MHVRPTAMIRDARTQRDRTGILQLALVRLGRKWDKQLSIDDGYTQPDLKQFCTSFNKPSEA